MQCRMAGSDDLEGLSDWTGRSDHTGGGIYEEIVKGPEGIYMEELTLFLYAGGSSADIMAFVAMPI